MKFLCRLFLFVLSMNRVVHGAAFFGGTRTGGSDATTVVILEKLVKLDQKVGKADSKVGKLHSKVGKLDFKVGKLALKVNKVFQKLNSDFTEQKKGFEKLCADFEKLRADFTKHVTEAKEFAMTTNKKFDETNKKFDETSKKLDETNKKFNETNKNIDGLRLIMLGNGAAAFVPVIWRHADVLAPAVVMGSVALNHFISGSGIVAGIGVCVGAVISGAALTLKSS